MAPIQVSASELLLPVTNWELLSISLPAGFGFGLHRQEIGMRAVQPIQPPELAASASAPSLVALCTHSSLRVFPAIRSQQISAQVHLTAAFLPVLAPVGVKQSIGES